MTLYVDNARTPYGRMRLSHLMADTTAELERARVLLGVPASAWHSPGTPDEHLDISDTKRRDAIARLGAVPVSSRQLVAIRQRKRRDRNQTGPRQGHTG